MEKPEYIKNIEKNTGEILSKMSLEEIEENDIPFDKKYYTLLFTDLEYKGGEVFWKEKVFKTIHGFYLYVNKSRNWNITIDIYYNPEQLDELTIFIKQFIKQIKK